MTQALGGLQFSDGGVLQTTVAAISSPEYIGGQAGTVVLKDGGSGGTEILTINTPGGGVGMDVSIPGGGIPFGTDLHVTLTNVDGVTVFYAPEN